MLDKRVYVKAIGISEIDLNYIRQLRNSKIGNKKSLAGILAFIINFYKKYDLPNVQHK
jgi:hypothetical protein